MKSGKMYCPTCIARGIAARSSVLVVSCLQHTDLKHHKTLEIIFSPQRELQKVEGLQNCESGAANLQTFNHQVVQQHGTCTRHNYGLKLIKIIAERKRRGKGREVGRVLERRNKTLYTLITGGRTTYSTFLYKGTYHEIVSFAISFHMNSLVHTTSLGSSFD